MRTENFDVRTVVDINAEVSKELVEKLADLIEYKLGVDVDIIGTEERGLTIEAIEHGEIHIYPSYNYYEPDDWDYSDFYDESDYEEVIAEFEKENNVDLDACVSTDF